MASVNAALPPLWTLPDRPASVSTSSATPTRPRVDPGLPAHPPPDRRFRRPTPRDVPRFPEYRFTLDSQTIPSRTIWRSVPSAAPAGAVGPGQTPRDWPLVHRAGLQLHLRRVGHPQSARRPPHRQAVRPRDEGGLHPFGFGQVSQLPQFYAGFGIDTIFFYRGITDHDSPRASFSGRRRRNPVPLQPLRPLVALQLLHERLSPRDPRGRGLRDRIIDCGGTAASPSSSPRPTTSGTTTSSSSPCAPSATRTSAAGSPRLSTRSPRSSPPPPFP